MCVCARTVSESVMVLVACGPYTPSDSLSYDPLIDLINVIDKDRPDVCILVRATLLQRKYSATNVDFAKKYISYILRCFVSCLTQLGPFVDSKHEQIEVG